MNPKRGTWAVILGASGGLGGACALSLARNGHHIFGVHLDTSSKMPIVEGLIREIRQADVEVEFANLNAASETGVKEGLDGLAQRLGSAGKVHVLVHALAFGALGPFIARSTGDRVIGAREMQMTMNVMAHSLVYWAQGIVNRGLFGDGAQVFALTSIGSTNVVPAYGAVSAAKSALESHVRQLAFELAPHHVAVNAIRAGVTETEALLRIPGSSELIARARQYNPHGRLGRAEDVAEAIASLSGSDRYWMTGNVIGVDGGEKLTL